MRRKGYLFLLVFVLLCALSPFAYAHTYKVSAIIDTDMALDDIRALVMVLNSDWIDVPLIVCSDGTVSPQIGCRNLRILLEYFEKRDTDIVAGRTLGQRAPPWRSWSENLNWPELSTITAETTKISSATDAILKTLNSSAEQVIYLCLGPLTNLADAIRRDSTVKENISRVIFYGTPPGALDPGWNYTRDRESADFVFKSGLNIHSLHIPQEKSLLFDQNLYDKIKTMHTRAARIVSFLHDTPIITELLEDGHFRVWDEITIIYLSHPSLFKLAPEEENTHIMVLADFRTDLVEQAYLKLLDYSADFHLNRRAAVVLNDFPVDPSMFKEDVGPYVKRIIEKHGLEEWKACFFDQRVSPSPWDLFEDISAALKTYGGLNREYFAHIRELSIDYWLELDRKKIFDETVNLKGKQK